MRPGLCIRLRLPKTAHFWHFMMGEFLPVIHAAASRNARVLVVYHPNRVWGECPLDRFYEDVSSETMRVRTSNVRRKGFKHIVLRERWDGRSKRARTRARAGRS